MDTSGNVRQRSESERQSKKRKSPGRPKKVVSTKVTNLRRSLRNATKKTEPTTTAAAATSSSSSSSQIDKSPVAQASSSSKNVNDLISDEDKKEIESCYYFDPTLIDEKKVAKKITTTTSGSYQCKICQSAYSRLDKCQVHVWRHLNMLPYVCHICNFKTQNVTSARGHIRKVHLKLKPFKCKNCKRDFATAGLLKKHAITTHTNDTNMQSYYCDSCDFVASSKRLIADHIMNRHKSEKDILCDICNEAFITTKQLRDHRYTHEESGAVQCEICQAYVSSDIALRRHHNKVHSKNFICEICNKSYKSKKILNSHVYQVHTESKYKCPHCSNAYKSDAMLQDHILKHQGIKKYMCEICGKSFTQRTHLTTHMAVHDDKRFECPGCKKGFNRRDNMKVHTKKCVKFLANPKLKEILQIRKPRVQTSSTHVDSVLKSSDAINITVEIDPTFDSDDTIEIEPDETV